MLSFQAKQDREGSVTVKGADAVAVPGRWLSLLPGIERQILLLRWLALAKRSPRLIANAGDQVPPGAVEDRIFLARDLVEQHGRY